MAVVFSLAVAVVAAVVVASVAAVGLGVVAVVVGAVGCMPVADVLQLQLLGAAFLGQLNFSLIFDECADVICNRINIFLVHTAL